MKPYLFLHIPKTGGSSIVDCLPDGRCTVNNFFKDSKDNNDLHDHGYAAARYHYTPEQYAITALPGIALWPQLYKFTFVRNPWDRVVSIFHDWKRQNSRITLYKNIVTGELHRSGVDLEDSVFSQFVCDILAPAMDPNVKKYQPALTINLDRQGDWKMIGNYLQPIENCCFYYTISNGHFTPQVKYTHDSGGNQIVDFVGKFETLQEDYDKLNEICGWNFKFMTLPHVNKSKRTAKDYRKYYEDGSGLAKHLISEIYREDIEAYGYTF